MPNQVVPISANRIGVDGKSSYISPVPDSAVSTLSLSIRVGKKKNPIGAVQSATFSMGRAVEPYYEIKPYAPDDFGSLSHLFSDTIFNQSLDFEGEPTALYPGVVEPIKTKLVRPMFFSSNILEAVFKSGGAGEFTTKEMREFRYNAIAGSDALEFIAPRPGELAAGAAVGAVGGLFGGDGLAGAGLGALVGVLKSLVPDEQKDPAKTRYANLLQQVRPFELSFLIYSPTQPNQIVFGLELINGWATNWDITNLQAQGSAVIMESLDVTFERVRLLRTL